VASLAVVIAIGGIVAMAGGCGSEVVGPDGEPLDEPADETPCALRHV
jgi:hypothetical protein